jgi:hypothetical protein
MYAVFHCISTSGCFQDSNPWPHVHKGNSFTAAPGPIDVRMNKILYDIMTICLGNYPAENIHNYIEYNWNTKTNNKVPKRINTMCLNSAWISVLLELVCWITLLSRFRSHKVQWFANIRTGHFLSDIFGIEKKRYHLDQTSTIIVPKLLN